MYRKALAAAAEARGWAVHWYEAKKVFDAASEALRIEDLDAHFLQLRRSIGSPWGKDHKVSGIYLFFPSLSYGRPLISHPNEKLEFRLILHQRVFETTFYVNSADLLDGKETVLRIPGRIDEPTPATDP